MKKIVCLLLICSFILGFYQNHKYKQLEGNFKIMMDEYEVLLDELSEAHEEANFKAVYADEHEIVQTACKLYNVDYALAMAIIRLETGNFTSDLYVNQNNAGGIKYNGEYATFETKEMGIAETVREIKTTWIDNGMTTPEQMESTYCACDGWAEKVRIIMSEYE